MTHKLYAAALIIAIGCATLVPGIAGAGRVHAATVTAQAVGRCTTAELDITPIGSSGGVGHIGLQFSIHNDSAQTCTLRGFPGALLLDGQQHPLPTTVQWGPGYLSGNRPVRMVTLAPGTDAYMTLEWVHIPSPGQTCPLAPYVLITPPNDTEALQVSLGRGAIDACGGQLTAAPVEPTLFDGFPAPQAQPSARYIVLTTMVARTAPDLTAVTSPALLVHQNAVLNGTGRTTAHWVEAVAGGRRVWLYRPNVLQIT